MPGFRTASPVLAGLVLVALGFAAGPALASGVGGAITDTPSTTPAQINTQANVTNNITGGNNVSFTKNIDTSSDISINKQINGQDVGYGLNGPNTLNNITDQTGAAATYNQNRHTPALQVEGAIMSAVGLPVY